MQTGVSMLARAVFKPFRTSILGVAGILAVVVLLILPMLRAMNMSKREIARLTTVRDDQRAYSPIYHNIADELATLRNMHKEWRTLELPPPWDLGQGTAVLLRLAEVAQVVGVQLTVIPDSVLGYRNQMKIHVACSGPAEVLRHYLYLVSVQPWVLALERVELSAGEAGTHTYLFTVLLQLKSVASIGLGEDTP